jgi:hypothetical protein
VKGGFVGKTDADAAKVILVRAGDFRHDLADHLRVVKDVVRHG